MKTLVLTALVLGSSAGIARADGWIKCSNPDDGGKCSATGDSAATGAGLAMIAVVAYGLGRKRRKR